MIKKGNNGYRNICKSCDYYNQGNNINRNNIPIEIQENNSDILIIVQAPGNNEWTYGIPLYNDPQNRNTAGSKMYDSWKLKNKSRKDFDILEVVRCYPGKNSNSGRDCAPSSNSVKLCSLISIYEINFEKYSKIIALGNVAHSLADKIERLFLINPDKIERFKHPSAPGITPTILSRLW